MGGIGSLWEALGWFARLSKNWKARFVRLWVCEALGGFERLREALGGFGMPCEVLQALDGFVMFWEASALEGFGKLLKSLGTL